MRGEKEVNNTQDSTIFPETKGKKLIFLDKEALLARLSNIRGSQKERIVDRFFFLSRDQGFYFTNIYIMSEVFSTVSSRATVKEAAQLRSDVLASSIEVRHGRDNWEKENLTKCPKNVFLAAAQALEDRAKIDCKLPEVMLVLQATAAGADYVFSYDEAVRKLSASFGVTTLPHVRTW